VEILNELKRLEPDRLTPIASLNLVAAWIRRLEERET
jgi:hypothetical protein